MAEDLAYLWDGHPIRVMMAEHEVLLASLARLDGACRGEPAAGVIARMRRDTATLLAAESHYRREEEALFPELEEIGLDGPCALMTEEHAVLRERKASLAAMLADGGAWSEIRLLVADLGGRLRDHIERESTVLFPEAVEALSGQAWARIGARCDEIGACRFD